MVILSPQFTRTITELFGDQGVAWLADLPALVDECARRWSLEVGPPFDPLSYNYVAPARRADGTEVALKLGVPNAELTSEIETLRLYGGDGIVRLYEAEPERGILLMERLIPGTPLAVVEDDEAATSIATSLLRRLWRPVPEQHPFLTVESWAAGLGRLRARFGGGTGPFPAAVVDRAERLFAGLIASTTEPMLMHGDFHHWNILAAEREPWLVIDPKGVVGDPGYEVGPWIANRVRDTQLEDPASAKRRMARILDQLAAELEMDRARLTSWAFAQAVLSAWWSFEDHGYGWERTIARAEMLATL